MTGEPLILSSETATLAGSIAVYRGAESLGSSVGDPSTSHSNTLLADIDKLLAELTIAIRDVDLFAVASGPGSFTGLRIGIASVKALAVTLDRPCIGIPTLEAIAHSAGESKYTVSMLPAGRGEVFAQMFSVSATDAVMALDEPVHLPPAQVVAKYTKFADVQWTGDGAIQHEALIAEAAAKGNYLFINSEDYQSPGWKIVRVNSILARNVAQLALARMVQAKEHTAIDLRALYVRPSDAELKH